MIGYWSDIMTEGAGRLRVVRGSPPPNVAVVLVCKRPACPRVVPTPSGPGYPLEYCSGDCREAAKAEHAEAVAQLRRAQAIVDQFKRERPQRRKQGLALPADAQVALGLARDLLGGTHPASDSQCRILLERLVAVLTSAESQ
jgi:hypothetical protein